MRHTQGPWKIADNDDTVVIKRTPSKNTIIAECLPYDPMNAYCKVTDEKEYLANTYLIAAAPEMYNLLVSLKDFVSDENEKIIEKLLKKARGEGE